MIRFLLIGTLLLPTLLLSGCDRADDEFVQKTGLKYMMAETSCYRADCHAMRQIYRAGGFGRTSPCRRC